MLSPPHCANDNTIPGADDRPQHILTEYTHMKMQNFTEEEKRGIDASLAYVEFLLARRTKKKLAQEQR
jgi:hypothetical protein